MRSSPRPTWRPPPTRSPGSGRYWTGWTSPTRWSPPTRSTHNTSTPTGWSASSTPVRCGYSDRAHALGVRIDLGLPPWRLRCTPRGGATVLPRPAYLTLCRFPSRRLPEVLKAVKLCHRRWRSGTLVEDTGLRGHQMQQCPLPCWSSPTMSAGGRVWCCTPQRPVDAVHPGTMRTRWLQAPRTRAGCHHTPGSGHPTGPGRAAPQWDRATLTDPRGRSQGGR